MDGALLVTGRDSNLAGADPNLKKVSLFLLGVIELTVCDACASRHALNVSRRNGLDISKTVFVREFASQGRFKRAARFHGAPTNRSQRVTLETDAPEILARCRQDQVDAALLVPT